MQYAKREENILFMRQNERIKEKYMIRMRVARNKRLRGYISKFLIEKREEETLEINGQRGREREERGGGEILINANAI